MRLFFITIILFFSGQIHAQKEIKKIILDDLLSLNDLYDGCIIQPTQITYKIEGADTSIERKTIDDLRDDFEDIVKIVRIDTAYFISVEVSFNLTSGGMDLFFTKIDSSGKKIVDKIFKYILYKFGDRYYKINGFSVSEILIARGVGHDSYKDVIKAPEVFFRNYLRYRKIDKIRKYLSISIFNELVNQGYYFDAKPYVKDIFCYLGW